MQYLQFLFFGLSAALLLSAFVASHTCAPVTLLTIVQGALRFIGGAALTQMSIMLVQIFYASFFYSIRIFKAPLSEGFGEALLGIMQVTKKMARVRISTFKTACLLLVLFSTTYTHAQTADTVKKEIRISEILTEEDIIEPPSAQEDVYDEEVTDDKYKKIHNNFSSIYFNDSVGRSLNQRNISSTVKDSFLNQSDFWYVNYKEKEKKTSGNSSHSGGLSSISWLGTFLWIVIIVGFLIFIAWWYTTNGQGALFRRTPKNFATANELHDIPEDIFAINYAAAINRAVTNNDYRLAIRLMYLQILANMHNRNIINYKQDATNFDYLTQLHQTGYYPAFFKVTRHYEYAWYGLFPVSKQVFEVIKQDVEALNQKINYR